MSSLVELPSTAHVSGAPAAQSAVPTVPEVPGVSTVEIAPRNTVAGEPACFAYVFTAAAGGIAPGGGVEIAKHNHPQLSEVQTDDPARAGYVTAETSGSCQLTIEAGLRSTFTWYARVTVHDAPLARGESITIRWGAPPSPGAIQQTTTSDRIVWDCNVDADGTGTWQPIPDVPSLAVVGSTATALRATLPVLAASGERIELRLAALDRWLNAARGYTGPVQLGSSDPLAELPSQWLPPHEARAVATIPIRFHSPGVHRVWLRDAAAGLTAESNPVTVSVSPPSERLFWGDLHVHSFGCDGIGWPDELFRYGRDVSHLDFQAITSHDMGDVEDWSFDDMRAAVQRWRAGQSGRTPDAATGETPDGAPSGELGIAPGSATEPTAAFVPFAGYEWRNSNGQAGHMCVVFKNPEEAVFLRGAEVRQAPSPTSLWEQLGEREALTIPHHTSAGHDWTSHNPRFRPLVEIYSDWGSSEFSGNPWWAQRGCVQGTSVRDALAKGYRLGLIGSGDDHTGLPGRTGLAAVWAPAATPDAIWTALRDRRTYATTGARMLLRFSAGEHAVGMGGELSTARPPTFEIDVQGTAALDRVGLVRDGLVAASWSTIHGADGAGGAQGADGSQLRVRWTDGEREGPAESWYYIRVRQQDGHLGWSSPIWVRRIDRQIDSLPGAGALPGDTAAPDLAHIVGAADRPHQLARLGNRKWTILPGQGPAICAWRQPLDANQTKLFISIGADDGAYTFDVTLRLRQYREYTVITHRLGGDSLESSDHFWDKHPLGTMSLWQTPRRAQAERQEPVLSDDGGGTVQLIASTEPRERACLEVIVRHDAAGGAHSCHALLEASVDGVAQPDVVWLGAEPASVLPLRIDLSWPSPEQVATGVGQAGKESAS